MGLIEDYIEKYGSLPERISKYKRAEIVGRLIEVQIRQLIACMEYDKEHGINTRELQVDNGQALAMVMQLPEHVGDYITQAMRSAFLDKNKNSVAEIFEQVLRDLAERGFPIDKIDFNEEV